MSDTGEDPFREITAEAPLSLYALTLEKQLDSVVEYPTMKTVVALMFAGRGEELQGDDFEKTLRTFEDSLGLPRYSGRLAIQRTLDHWSGQPPEVLEQLPNISPLE